MPRTKSDSTKSKSENLRTPMRPALTAEARENQMISLAVDLAEKQLREGTASSQVITHYLKLGSSREKIEQEIKAKEKELLVAKTDNIKKNINQEQLLEKALKAMRRYSGNDENDIKDDEYEE